VEVCDGVIEKVEPETVVGHVSIPIGQWIFNIPYS
jgi:hypothetical protein